MTDTMTTPRPEIARDHWKRPLVIPEGGGKPVAYTRCTTYVDGIDDKYNLQQWEKRMVAIGLSQRKDLLLAAAAHRDDRTKLDAICADAKDAGMALDKATIGTALHAFTEQMDRGEDLGVVPAEYQEDLTAYFEATQEFKALHIEAFCVLDPLQIGGTPDRIVKYQGKTYIADVKTGSIEYGALKIAAQLAVYARSKLYDIATGERSIHGAELDKGIIIHLPAGEARCELVWTDLLEGWSAVQVCKQIREKRKLRFPQLTRPFHEPEPAVVEELPPVPLAVQIALCETDRALRELWAENQDRWTDALTAAAQSRLAELRTA